MTFAALYICDGPYHISDDLCRDVCHGDPYLHVHGQKPHDEPVHDVFHVLLHGHGHHECHDLNRDVCHDDSHLGQLRRRTASPGR